MNLGELAHKGIVWLVKAIPLAGTIGYTMHCLSLIEGFNIPLTQGLFGLSVATSLLMACLSIEFGLCALHKLFTLYMVAMEFCILFQQQSGFGHCLPVLRWLMFFFGCLLIWEYIVHRKTYWKPIGRHDEILNKILDKVDDSGDKQMEEKIRRITAEVLLDAGVTTQIKSIVERIDDLEDEKMRKKTKFIPCISAFSTTET